MAWLFEEARRRGIPVWKLYPRLDGIRRRQAGPIRVLPQLHERAHFLRQPQLVEFFDAIASDPTEARTCTLSAYTVSISYFPDAQGPYTRYGGLIQEAPTSVAEHAVYRMLKAKAQQHDVTGPRIVCIGSDQSPALLNPGRAGPSFLQNAAAAAFSEHPSLSGTIIVVIEDTPMVIGKLRRQARAELMINPIASDPLTPEEIQSLHSLNFNQWTYTSPNGVLIRSAAHRSCQA